MSIADKRVRHGMSRTRIYKIWKDMRRRCSNPKRECYKRYGGRGIRVCDEWHDFINFYEWSMANGYCDNLTIDRINNDGNYEPSNCRWTNQSIQAINRMQKESNSGERGIYKETYKGKRGTTVTYIAHIKRNGVRHHIGRFKTLEEAFVARNEYTRLMGVI